VKKIIQKDYNIILFFPGAKQKADYIISSEKSIYMYRRRNNDHLIYNAFDNYAAFTIFEIINIGNEINVDDYSFAEFCKDLKDINDDYIKKKQKAEADKQRAAEAARQLRLAQEADAAEQLRLQQEAEKLRVKKEAEQQAAEAAEQLRLRQEAEASKKLKQ
jgi:hypothetical protein